MPSNNSKYTQEIREQTVRYILDTGKSATSVAEEMGIDKNTVCQWVRDYRRKHNMPSYAEEKGITRKQPQTEKELLYRIKELIKRVRKVFEDTNKVYGCRILGKPQHGYRTGL